MHTASTNFAKTLVWKHDYDVTSNCDVTNSAHQIQMPTTRHWMKALHENFLRTPLHTRMGPSKVGYIITSPDPCTTSGRLPSGCRTCGAKLFWDILATRLNQRSWVLYIRRSGSRQYRSNATPLDAFHDVPSCVLSWTRQNMRRPVSLGILPRFLEKLLESLSLVSSAAAVTITALDIIKLWFHYFTSSFCKAQHISL